jgi:hypothetical protein
VDRCGRFGQRVLASYTPAMVTTGAYLAGTLLIISRSTPPPARLS